MDTGLSNYVSWAKLRSKNTGHEFLAVSVHLNPFYNANCPADIGKPSHNNPTYTQRHTFASQASTLKRRIASINTTRLPVLMGGDMNSNEVGDSGCKQAHEQFIDDGWTDMGSTARPTNLEFATTARFATSGGGDPLPARANYGRIDYLYTQGLGGPTGYRTDIPWATAGSTVLNERSSDHFMVIGATRLNQ